MNQVLETASMQKGAYVELKGIIIYEQTPRASRYGNGFSQFLVISDNQGDKRCEVGVNVNMAKIDDGFVKGHSVIVKGKVDKYPDKKQPLLPNGTYPLKTSIKADSVEEFREVNDFVNPEDIVAVPESPTASVMTPEELEIINKPDYVQSKQEAKDEESKMWAAKDLIVAKQSACKTVGKWIESGKIDLTEYFAWATKLVEFFYNEDDKFVVITEANLMKSGLVDVTKAQVTDWITERMKGTDIVWESVSSKAISSLTLTELLDTAVKVALSL